MVYVTTVTISVTGVAQPLASQRNSAAWVAIQSDPSNSGSIYHGPSTVTTSTGQIIGSGGGGGSPQYPPISDVTPYDLSRIYVVGTANDIVRVMYFKR